MTAVDVNVLVVQADSCARQIATIAKCDHRFQPSADIAAQVVYALVHAAELPGNRDEFIADARALLDEYDVEYKAVVALLDTEGTS